MKEGVKFDDDKLRYDLVPAEAMEELVKVYTVGANKYGPLNYLNGICFSRILAAIFRHLWAWVMGEEADKETGLHPLAHVAWGCFTLITYSKRGYGPSWDDRRSLNTHYTKA